MFRSRKKKISETGNKKKNEGSKKIESVEFSLSMEKSNNSRSSYPRNSEAPSPRPTSPIIQQSLSIESLPSYIGDLKKSSSEKAARALRKLFGLSEDATNSQTRTEMVRAADGELVPTLLNFLNRCERGSSEQYLALLVLNNISAPAENKRLIALEHGGARTLARLLCADPSCHLVAIVLVNLTFSDAELRKDLVEPTCDIQLIESLAFAVLVSSLTKEEYNRRGLSSKLGEDDSQTPTELLTWFRMEEQRLRNSSAPEEMERYPNYNCDSSQLVFPDTARWSLCAIKNLTRPSKYANTAHVLINTGVVPHILRFIVVSDLARDEKSASSNSSGDSPAPAEPLLSEDCNVTPRSPCAWDSHTAQDAALFIVINLAAVPSARDYMREVDAIRLLSAITEFEERGEDFVEEMKLSEQVKISNFQRIKARMALSYLVGSEGHFGQPRNRDSSSVHAEKVYASFDDGSVLVVTETEAMHFVELLANTLHRRSKNGPGGYSAATFSAKYVLFAIRCLLTNNCNQICFTSTEGVQLNMLLIKVLALHAFESVSYIDPEAAEHAAFSLYLLSNCGFKSPFLASSLGNTLDVSQSLAAKILADYRDMALITPAGKHAAEQLLLRLKYLQFEGSAKALSRPHGAPLASDLVFGPELMERANNVHVGMLKTGARPRDDLCDRPILRSRFPRKGSNRRAPWDNHGSIDYFPSALIAAQELSFGSTKVRHLDAVDDVRIANNIAKSANGEKTESYNYMWSWQDTAGEIQRNLERQNSSESFLTFRSSATRRIFPFPALRHLPCGPLCGADTTLK